MPQQQEKAGANFGNGVHIVPDPKFKNKLAQKRFRDRNKQKFDILEETVTAMTRRLQELEKRKLELQTQVSHIQGTHNFKFSSAEAPLPELEKVQIDFTPAVSWAGLDPKGPGGLILQTVFDQPRRLTRAQGEKLSTREVRNFHEEYLIHSGRLLAENPHEDWHSPAGRKLKPWIWLQLNDPDDSANRMLEDLNRPNYRHLIDSLKLTQHQKQSVRNSAMEYFAKTRNLSCQREELKQVLQSVPVEGTGLEKISKINSLHFNTTVRKLRDNIDAAHVADSVFWGSLFNLPNQLNYFQEARLLLEAWPLVPDPFQLFNELERQLTGHPVSLAELSSRLPPESQEEDLQEETPYVDLMEKLLSEFQKIGFWNQIGVSCPIA